MAQYAEAAGGYRSPAARLDSHGCASTVVKKCTTALTFRSAGVGLTVCWLLPLIGFSALIGISARD